jgi:uncharacterized protein
MNSNGGKGTMKSRVIWLSVALAAMLWYVMFVVRPMNFWLMMAFSTSLLTLITLAAGRDLFVPGEVNWKNIGLGLASAGVLYLIFFAGNQALKLVEEIFPRLIDNRTGHLNAIYANGEQGSRLLVALLLFFPIGFGEEFFWRGLVQKHFSRRWSRWTGFLVTTAVYTAVHIPTGNPVLILAALVCGLYWGGLYAMTGRLVPVLVSHMVWDPFIFVFLPIQ